MTLRITEVFFGAHTFKRGQQWFEVYNEGPEPVNLSKAIIKRLDGEKKKQQAWVAKLPEQDFILEPERYVVIAQKPDLGQNLCSGYPVILLKELRLESSGIQRLCLDNLCVKISDSKSTEKDLSRNLLLDSWFPEICEIKSGLFASPGLPTAFCQKGLESGWVACPEPVQEVKAIPRQSVRHSGGCQTVVGGAGAVFELCGVLILGFVFKNLKVSNRK
jgi:hypothetical protein